MAETVKVYGKENDYDSVINLMDDDIREELHSKMAPCEAQEFVNAYIEKHEEKFGESFVVN